MGNLRAVAAAAIFPKLPEESGIPFFSILPLIFFWSAGTSGALKSAINPHFSPWTTHLLETT